MMVEGDGWEDDELFDSERDVEDEFVDVLRDEE